MNRENFSFLRARYESNYRKEIVLDKMLKIKKDIKSLIERSEKTPVPRVIIHAKIDLYNFWANLIGEEEICFKKIIESDEWPQTIVGDYLDKPIAIVVPSREEAAAMEDLTKIFHNNIVVFVGAHSLITGLLSCEKKYAAIISLRGPEIDDELINPIKEIILVSLAIFSEYNKELIKQVIANLSNCIITDEIYTGPFHLFRLIESFLTHKR